MANRYWVGNGGDWQDTAHWSTSSGGAGGAAEPTSADNVYFDANSFSSAGQHITFNDTFHFGACKDLDFTGVTNDPGFSYGYAYYPLNVYGSLKLTTGMHIQSGISFTFRATTAGQTITTAGRSNINYCIFYGAGGGWTLQDNSTLNYVVLLEGSLDTNNKTIVSIYWNISGIFVDHPTPTTRALTLGSSVMTIGSGNYDGSLQAQIIWDASNTTGLTFNAGTSIIGLEGASVSNVSAFLGGGLTYYDVDWVTAYNLKVTGANTFHNFTMLGGSSECIVQFPAGVTQTMTLFSTVGGSATDRPLICSSTIFSAATISAATVTMSYADFRDITGSGAGTWSGTAIGNRLGNSGITFTTPVTRYLLGGGSLVWESTGSWSASSGGASGASVPLPQDNVRLDANTTASSLTAGKRMMCTNFDCTGLSGSITITPLYQGGGGIDVINPNFEVLGSMILTANVTMNSTTGFGEKRLAVTFRSRSTGKSIDMQGATMQGDFIWFDVYGLGGGWTLGSNFSLDISYGVAGGYSFGIFAGAFNTNGYEFRGPLGFGGFNMTGDFTRSLTLGSSAVYLVDGIVISGTNYSVNAGTSHVHSMHDRQTFSMAPGLGITWYDVTLTNNQLIEIGGNTYHNLNMTNPFPPYSYNQIIYLDAAHTTTVTGLLTITGTDHLFRTFILPLDYTSGFGLGCYGLPATISAASVSLAYCDFQDTHGTGAAAPFACASVGDMKGNSGISFDAPGTRYWVGNGGNWSDNASHWSTSSGGSPGAPIPIAQDTVVFDANSFSSSGQTVTVDGGFNWGPMDWTGALHTPTFHPGSNGFIDITGSYGNMTFISSMVITPSSTLFIGGRTSGENSVRTNGCFPPFTWVQGGLTLLDDWTGAIRFGAYESVQLIYGTLTTNNHNMNLGALIYDNFAAHSNGVFALGISTILIMFQLKTNEDSTFAGRCSFTGDYTIKFADPFDNYNYWGINLDTIAHDLSLNDVLFDYNGLTSTDYFPEIHMGSDHSLTMNSLTVLSDTPHTELDWDGFDRTVPRNFTVGTITVNGTLSNPIVLTGYGDEWNITATNVHVSYVDLSDSYALGV